MVGDEPLVVQCVETARVHDLDVVLVASTNPVVRTSADEQAIPVVDQGGALARGLRDHRADVLLSIANEHVIDDEALAAVSTAIHLHDGPVPGYVGLHATTWAILNGEREHAITWHLLTPARDIVAVERFPIRDDETAFSLNARCFEAALASFPRIAAAVAAENLVTEPPPRDGPSRTFTSSDRPSRLLDPSVPARETAQAVRALDLGHRIRNTVGSVRWVLGHEVYVVEAAHPEAASPGAPVGTLIASGPAAARIATTADDLVITAVSTAEGDAADVQDVLVRHGIGVGAVVPSPPRALVEALAELEPIMAVDEGLWLDRLAEIEPPPAAPAPASLDRVVRSLARPDGADDEDVLAAVAVWLARATGTTAVSVAVTEPRSRRLLERTAPLTVPGTVRADIGPDATFAEVRDVLRNEIEMLHGRSPLLRDAIGRDPRLRGHVGQPPVVVELGQSTGVSSAALRITVDEAIVIDARSDADDPGAVDRIAEQLATVLAGGLDDPMARAVDLPLLGPGELAVLDAINRTARDHDRTATIDALFHGQAARTPDAPAVTSGGLTLTYAELAAATNALARRLAACGVGRGDRVGIAVPRGVEMVVGVLATLDLGAAYLPLDPTYPMERLGLMVDDAGIAVLLATPATATELARPHITVVDPSVVDPSVAEHDGAADDVTTTHDAADLAYLIYTSGSTGLPKGVMLEHRQVTNFFAAMDEVIDGDPPGVWLAVTSLSFDISVLELLWTLTRGFHVVLKADRGVPSRYRQGSSAPAAPVRPVSFSLFYFAAGDEAASDGYRLLLESARFADRHRFEAVWTPERHFHSFGGAYPNPSVTGAALAAITTNVGVRAGSVVLPLHSPIRVAEEWAVVDNLSRGRVAISFAAGWQPNDFVLNPTAFATAKDDLPRNIELVQRLWRGETVTMPGHDGGPVEVRTLPRPVQAELPVWLTSAGSPATFERAGQLGVNVLTHLLGQSVDRLAENIERYRAAWRDAGHKGDGRVTLMMHTYLDRDADTAREVAREPMKSYLGTAVGLLRDFATSFPIFAKSGQGADDIFKSLTADELDELLEMAAQRYLSTSGLFGTAAEAAEMVEVVSAVGVDEVACLIDFGVATDDVLVSLELLADAKARVDARRAPGNAAPPGPDPRRQAEVVDEAEDTVAALVARHGVTHLQCTPSLASMLAADPADRAALGSISHLMVGGEALPVALAAELRSLLPGRLTNMYGPTETTIWSLTHELSEAPAAVIPIGTPIANTTLFVLDRNGGRVPVGAFGELHIGGEGVARGYHQRPELTAVRFVDHTGMDRVYATGDIVRIHPAGHVEFAGRADNQVKIRGHRIELGEIEGVIDRHPDVVQSVVVARDDNSETRLVAYVVARNGSLALADTVRKHVAEILPEAMVPSAVVQLDSFPLTPNGKIDRKALPTDRGTIAADAPAATAPPADDVERMVADIWRNELQRPVGRDDNFFEIGGHSLLAVKIFRRLDDATTTTLSLTDIFRFPTVRTFAAHLGSLESGAAPDATSADALSGTARGSMRLRALTRRGRGTPADSG